MGVLADSGGLALDWGLEYVKLYVKFDGVAQRDILSGGSVFLGMPCSILPSIICLI